jgi:glycosyltransferase involved in cell wall biosynthesis
MHIWLIEPYFTGSHRAWAEGYARHSRHQVTLLTMDGLFWKWRMQGGAIELARQAAALWEQGQRPDVVLASGMVNLPAWIGLARPRLGDTPIVLYCHENQLTYPLPPGEKRDLTYAMINWLSMLAADRICFNSRFHLEQFFAEMPHLLKHFPDYSHPSLISAARARAEVLPVGCDLRGLDALRPAISQRDQPPGPPIVLWNQRWEYDKNPAEFFAALECLASEGIAFRVAVAGENFRQAPAAFAVARAGLGDRIIQWGFAEIRADYARLLWDAAVVVSTAWHEFFGVAAVEAIYCGCLPLLPNRLSYPDLIPPSHHGQCLYVSGDDLVSRLRAALVEPRPAPPALRQAAAQYDWAVLAPAYDDLLERSVEERRRTVSEMAWGPRADRVTANSTRSPAAGGAS